MSTFDNDEIKAVNKLYRDGKITKAQRKALIEALKSADGGDEKRRAADDKKSDTIEFVFSVSGMNDPYDASRVTTICANAKGAEKAHADVKSARVVVCGEIDPSKVAKALAEAGYPARPVDVNVSSDSANVNVKIGDGNVTVTDGGETMSLTDYLQSAGGKVKSTLSKYIKTDDEKDEYDDYFDDEDDDDDDEYDEDEEDEEDEDGDEDDNGMGKGFGAMMSKIGAQIKSAVKKGLATAERAEKQAVEAVNNAMAGVYSFADGNLVKYKAEQYDGVDYDDMEIAVKYVNCGTTYRCVDKTVKAQKILAECREQMTDDMYEHLKKVIDDRFVGSYVYASSTATLKVTVKPQ